MKFIITRNLDRATNSDCSMPLGMKVDMNNRSRYIYAIEDPNICDFQQWDYDCEIYNQNMDDFMEYPRSITDIDNPFGQGSVKGFGSTEMALKMLF